VTKIYPVIPLSKAPTEVLEAGVEYANGERESVEWGTIYEQDGEIVIDLSNPEGFDLTASNNLGVTDTGGGTVKPEKVKGTPEAFRKVLEKRREK